MEEAHQLEAGGAHGARPGRRLHRRRRQRRLLLQQLLRRLRTVLREERGLTGARYGAGSTAGDGGGYGCSGMPRDGKEWVATVQDGTMDVL